MKDVDLPLVYGRFWWGEVAEGNSSHFVNGGVSGLKKI